MAFCIPVRQQCGRLGPVRDSVAIVYDLVANLAPLDSVEAGHITDTLRWLEATDDIFRRSKPAIPDPHLVAYSALLDPDNFDVLLVDHVKSGLFLPPGGHVEPDEHPAETARRECREELGIDAPMADEGMAPAFVTVATTIGIDRGHTDVSLWFVLEGSRSQELTIDQVEFRGARWWSFAEVAAADGRSFDPHFQRFMRKVSSLR
jgi:8-oxo-dGTP diphosphatase